MFGKNLFLGKSMSQKTDFDLNELDRLNEINSLQPGSVTQKKLDDVAMLNKGKKNKTKTIIVNKTQVVQTTVTV